LGRNLIHRARQRAKHAESEIVVAKTGIAGEHAELSEWNASLEAELRSAWDVLQTGRSWEESRQTGL
jgi:hypothetical protein